MTTAGESPAFIVVAVTAGPTAKMTPDPATAQNFTLTPINPLVAIDEEHSAASGRSDTAIGADGSTNQPARAGVDCSAQPGRDDVENAIIELFEGGVGKPRDEWRVEEANRRLKIIQTFDELISQGKTQTEAVKLIGESQTSIWRYQKYYKLAGYAGLLPKTQKCGRKSWLEKLGLTVEELQTALDAVQGVNLDVNSVTGALRTFASTDACPPRLADVILDPNRCSKHAIPRSIRDAAKINKNQKLAHRGPRTLSLKGIYIPRRMDVLPGDVFTADDTTPIWAWWVPWRECEDYPFGVKLLQGQFIPIMDVASQAVITFVLIARERSSYRAADIWHLFGYTFDEVGLPRLGFQLERGSWEANIIRGQEIIVGADEASYSRRVGGLRQLPCNPHDQTPADFTWPKTLQTFTSFLPKSKSIEAWFKRNQSLEGTLWGSLGSDQMRLPFEKAKKLFQQCSAPRSKIDPRHYFLSHTEIAQRIAGIIEHVNNEPMEGEVFKGIPRVNFEAAIRERPLFRFNGVPELEDLRWLYRRDWTVLTITSGWARVRLTHPISGERYSLFYNNPNVFAKIEGAQIAVYFDRERFQDNAQIVAASKFSVDGQTYEPGDYVCEAQYVDRVGAFLGSDRTGHDIAKQWRQAVMSTYATIVKHAPSRQLPFEIEQRRIASKAGIPAPTLAPKIVDCRPAAEPVQQTSSPTKQDTLRRAAMSALRNLE
jgi:hypothetical protein